MQTRLSIKRFLILSLLIALPPFSPLQAQTRGQLNQTRARQNPDAPWYLLMDTGPFAADTFRLYEKTGPIAALKGVAIKIGEDEQAGVLFDTELLRMSAGFFGSVTPSGTPWDHGSTSNTHTPSHNDHDYFFVNPTGPGWSIDGDFTDPRLNANGPLPKHIAKYRGLYRHANRVVLHYTVANTTVLESPEYQDNGSSTAITRTFQLSGVDRDLTLLVTDAARPGGPVLPDVTHHLVGAPDNLQLSTRAGRTLLRIPAGTPACNFKLVYARGPLAPGATRVPDLKPLTRGGPRIYPESIQVAGQPGSPQRPYTVDTIPLPVDNPWNSSTRFGGFDIFDDGRRAACSTWNGDVWIAHGIDGDLQQITWTRYASGLFQTLGLKIVDGVIYTQGRDQITRLHDLNNDGEVDYYECFNNDVLITSGFHEFSFGLQTDAAGNFYFAKAMPVQGGGRGFSTWTPHNGTVLKVSPDGSSLTPVAWGLRAPGGIAVSPEGVVTTGENEGSYVPQCKISWNPPGKLTFNGVVPSEWDGREHVRTLPGAPTDYDRPLCWLPYSADNSGGGQVWVPEDSRWDPRHAGQLLHLSYGKSTVYRVLREEVDGQTQGGVYRLPIDVTAATMRARFNPANHDLYLIGFRGWQTNGSDAFQRVRFTGPTAPQPVALHAHANGMVVKFSAPLDPAAAEDPARYSVSKWDYIWGPQYGSGRFSIDHTDAQARAKALVTPSKGAHNIIDSVNVAAAKLLDDGASVFLYMPNMTPAMQMEIKMDLEDAHGASFRETIYNSVYKTRPAFTLPGVRFEDIPVVDTSPRGEPGLVMSFGGVITDNVATPQLALNCPPGVSPSVFIGASAFEAVWQGTLYMPQRDDITFSIEGRGHATLRIDGQVILDGPLPATASVPVTLAKGGHPIFCSYKSLGSGEARVRLMWSGRQFKTEPVPASAFRYIPSGEVDDWRQIREGRTLFAAAQCVRCHAPRKPFGPKAMPELSETAPDFRNIGARLETTFLARWARNPQGHCPTIAPEKAADIAAYLGTLREPGAPPVDPSTLIASPKTASEGQTLVEKLNLGFWIDPLKSDRRHTLFGLLEFLQHPAKHHVDTTFPDVRLTEDEAQRIAAYILMDAPITPPNTTPPTSSQIDRGRLAVTQHCVVCHDPKPKTKSAISYEEIVGADWTRRGCVSVNRGAAPDLRLSVEQTRDLLAFRNADRDVGFKSLKNLAPAEYAQRQRVNLNCAQCHTGQNKFPTLAYAGEKLSAGWLTTLFEGGHPGKTRQWLEARMPAFASRGADLAQGLAFQHGVTLTTPDSPPINPILQAVGAQLGDLQGYACVTCHDAGSRKALQVFEGQGPNLRAAAQRLRYDYYQRWMHNPRRIAPTTIMPQYLQPNGKALLEQHLQGDAEQHFLALWQWMHTLQP